MSNEQKTLLSIVKQVCSIPDDVNDFDSTLLSYMSSSIMSLEQLGLRFDSFELNKSTDISIFKIMSKNKTDLDSPEDVIFLYTCASYIAYKVRLLFDPPSTSFVIAAIENQIKELEFRILVKAQEIESI